MNMAAEIEEKDHQKPWTIDDDSYRFAPKREGDPWQRLLDPVLQKEKIRCDGWKDEVGNLLIFAGLFSAVVTAFIIEWYKTLQPDPSQDVVSLLSQISVQLSNPGNGALQIASNSTNLPSSDFAPTHSAIRVNVFWFLSLILSLATVLVGIVALQWLREYQAYPGQSARETLAIHRMRAEGMDRWHVWKILAALPLLLQVALVLFFAGVIDFLDVIGNKAVTVSATTAIAIALFFLVTTATLPAIQILYLRIHLMFPFLLKEPPSQCPYKSPQSNLFRAASDTCPRILASLFAYFLTPFRYALYIPLGDDRWQRIKRLLKKPFINLKDDSKLPIRYHLLSFRLWTKTWIDFDLIWLQVRDAYSRCRDKDFDMAGIEIEDFISQIIPLFDIVQAICYSNDSYDIDKSSDVYHCYSDLSKLLTLSHINSQCYRGINIHILWRRNRHFRSFIPITDWAVNEDEMINHLKPDVDDWEGGFTDNTASTSDTIKVLHELNMNKFLTNRTHPASGLGHSLHHEEVRFRIQNFLFGRKTTLDPNAGFPSCLHIGYAGSHKSRLAQVAIRRQYILAYKQFFHYLCRPDTVIVRGDLHAHSCIWDNLRLLGITVSQEIVDSSKGDHEKFSPAEDFLRHLIVNLSKATPEEKPRQNMIYAMLYAALPLHSIEQRLEERNDTHSEVHNLYKKLLSIVRGYMKRPINMDDTEQDVSIDTVLDQTGDPFDVLAFLTQASHAPRDNMFPFSLNRGIKPGQIPDPNRSSAQVDIRFGAFDIERVPVLNNNNANLSGLNLLRDIEQGVSSPRDITGPNFIP